MKKNIRVLALIFTVIFIAFAVISLSFQLLEADHDCSGADCPVCHMLAFFCAVLKSVFVLVVTLLSVLSAQGAIRILCASKTEYDLTATPVRMKVKLSN